MSIRFSESEIETAGGVRPARGVIPSFNYPISPKEGWMRAVGEHKPVWICNGAELYTIYPSCIPDNIARGFANDGGIFIPEEQRGGQDMFGINWVFVPKAGGSMEDPAYTHPMEDANDWPSVIRFPDIDAWDWKGSVERNARVLETNAGKFISTQLLNGFGYERLVSFMGFENAAIALLDEDQRDALIALFDRLANLCCDLVDRFCEYYPMINGFTVHDDWGSQRAPFFSPEIGREVFLPAQKKIVDHIHAKNRLAELHSCGSNGPHLATFVSAGWDLWCPMSQINDTYSYFMEYGDRMAIGVAPSGLSPDMTETEMCAHARAFAEMICTASGKVGIIGRPVAVGLPYDYARELYKASRQFYSLQD